MIGDDEPDCYWESRGSARGGRNVKAFSFGDIVSLVKAWQASLPKKRYMVVAVFLVALGAWVRSKGLKGVETFCDQMIHDLGLIQPFSFVDAYFQNLTACDRTSSVIGGDHVNCSSLRFINPQRLVGTLITTIGDLWNRSDGPGRVILPLAMLGAFPIAISIIFSASKRMFDSSEFNLFHVCFAGPLTPFIASIFALVLQLLAIALFFVFGKVVGLIVLVVTFLAGPLAIWKFYESTVKMAKKLESITETVAPGLAGDAVDREKPK